MHGASWLPSPLLMGGRAMEGEREGAGIQSIDPSCFLPTLLLWQLCPPQGPCLQSSSFRESGITCTPSFQACGHNSTQTFVKCHITKHSDVDMPATCSFWDRD